MACFYLNATIFIIVTPALKVIVKDIVYLPNRMAPKRGPNTQKSTAIKEGVT